MELTQLPSVKKKYEAQVTDRFPSLTQALFSACKVSAELGNFLSITQDHQMGSSGVHRSEVPASNKISLAKES